MCSVFPLQIPECHLKRNLIRKESWEHLESCIWHSWKSWEPQKQEWQDRTGSQREACSFPGRREPLLTHLTPAAQPGSCTFSQLPEWNSGQNVFLLNSRWYLGHKVMVVFWCFPPPISLSIQLVIARTCYINTDVRAAKFFFIFCNREQTFCGRGRMPTTSQGAHLLDFTRELSKPTRCCLCWLFCLETQR